MTTGGFEFSQQYASSMPQEKEVLKNLKGCSGGPRPETRDGRLSEALVARDGIKQKSQRFEHNVLAGIDAVEMLTIRTSSQRSLVAKMHEGLRSSSAEAIEKALANELRSTEDRLHALQLEELDDMDESPNFHRRIHPVRSPSNSSRSAVGMGEPGMMPIHPVRTPSSPSSRKESPLFGRRPTYDEPSMRSASLAATIPSERHCPRAGPRPIRASDVGSSPTPPPMHLPRHPSTRFSSSSPASARYQPACPAGSVVRPTSASGHEERFQHAQKQPQRPTTASCTTPSPVAPDVPRSQCGRSRKAGGSARVLPIYPVDAQLNAQPTHLQPTKAASAKLRSGGLHETLPALSNPLRSKQLPPIRNQPAKHQGWVTPAIQVGPSHSPSHRKAPTLRRGWEGPE